MPTETLSPQPAREAPGAGGRTDRVPGSDTQVYTPHRVGLPPLGRYLRDTWNAREFAIELARTRLRAQNYNTVFGQLWLVLNPLVLSAMYFLLIEILRGGHRGFPEFVHIVGGLFLFHMLIINVLKDAATSVVSGAKLILNSAFPRVLLPLSSVLGGVLRFGPAIGMYAIFHVAAGLPIDVELLWAFVIIAVIVGVTAGFSMLVATVNVYFRDLNNFITYLCRIWMYATPVLYFASRIPDRFHWLLYGVNPVGALFTALGQVLDHGRAPDAGLVGIGVAWAVGIIVVGGLFLISREREFAVRL
jgi:teichoic acid transport system permease protein